MCTQSYYKDTQVVERVQHTTNPTLGVLITLELQKVKN